MCRARDFTVSWETINWPAPAAEERADGSDRADGAEGPLVVPGGAAAVEDCVGEREEELDVPLDPILVTTMVVAAGDELREQGPVPGWKLGVGAVRPILGDHLLLVGEPRTEVEQGLRLGAVVR
jgi:hypothetical protein